MREKIMLKKIIKKHNFKFENEKLEQKNIPFGRCGW